MKKICSLLFALSFVLAFSSTAIAQSDEAVIKQEKATAAMLLKEGRAEEAYEAYALLLEKKPIDVNINLGYARASLASKRYGHAVMAYERLLANYPNEPMLLNELAYALSMQEDTQRAEMELSKNPKTSAQENADLLASWNKEKELTQVSGKISLGVLYDSNVNAGPASRELKLGVWDVTLSEESEQQETIANYIAANINLAHRFDENSPWWVTAKAGFYARYNYAADIGDQHLSSTELASGSVGIRHLTNRSMFEMNLNAQVFDYQFYENVFAVGPEINFVYAVTPKIHLITNLKTDHRAYSDNSLYNGWYSSAGQYARFFLGDAGHYLTIGGRYLNASTNESNYSYNGFEASLDLTFILPYNMSLSSYIVYSGEYYNGVATALEEDNREDTHLRVGANFMIPLSEAWEIAFGYQYTKNFSNSELFEYDQHLATFTISWKF